MVVLKTENVVRTNMFLKKNTKSGVGAMKVFRCAICLFLTTLLFGSAVTMAEASVTHCKGIKLCGKVKVVERFADLKVQVVKNFPDLKVKKVKNFANDIGEWQFVSHGEDFTIQYVDHFPDLKIKFVEHFPG